ncbi:PhnE/PtxC family ABC transporter permease [Paracoccus sp. (in: a-proteobacteria)]|uniref:PhnE/PtxC family ABC transporter permease n=1 Tax=Paracoccus sp. TaxID=267 RepID=UPI0035AF6C28
MRFIASDRRWRPRGRIATTLIFVGIAVLLLPVADLRIAGHDPWAELGRMGQGLLAPDFSAIPSLSRAAALTVAFALCGVAAGALAGFLLAPFYGRGAVRALCVAARSIHELFWAILLMQVTGLSATTGILALAIPYAGIFAKVFSEYLDEADPRPARAMPPGTGAISIFFFARLPLAIREFGTYTLYRLECGLRSSAVLGFVGLPTLGFELDTFFKQGMYGAVAAVLIVYYLLIATIRLWMRWPLAPAYVLAAAWVLSGLRTPPMAPGALMRFLGHDIVPAPLRNGSWGDPATWDSLGAWVGNLAFHQALPGLAATLIVAQLAVVLAGVVAVIGFPLLLRPVVGRLGVWFGHLGLVIGRSTPEYMLAYVMLQILGPSMLPAVIALGLHNGAIIAHLLGRQSQGIHAGLRPDASAGFDLYAWEILPRIHGNFLALCFYRWEIIVRESAIVGLLGIGTLGFYVGAAIQEIRVDRAVFLLLVTMAATIVIDMISRRSRASLGLTGASTRPALPTERDGRLPGYEGLD